MIGWRSGRNRPTGCPGTHRSTRCWTGSDAPFAKWFCRRQAQTSPTTGVDRHVEAGNGDRVAIRWEGEPGDSRELTYADLLAEVSKAANAADRSWTGGGRSGGDLHADGGPRRSWRCWRARAWVCCIPWCSPASRQRRWRLASRMPRPSWSSPPTGSTGAGQAVSLKEAVDEAVAAVGPAEKKKTRSSTFLCGAAHRKLTRRGPTGATCGGTIPSRRHRPHTRRRRFDSEHPLFSAVHVGYHR